MTIVSEKNAVTQNTATAYDTDFQQWLLDQVALLRAGKTASLDAKHIIEELEGLAASDRRELINRLIVLYVHLLKWFYQPARRGSSWAASIDEARTQIELVLEDSPSLRQRLPEFAAKAYAKARKKAQRETGLALTTFPEHSEWPIEQILDENWPL